MVAALNLNIRSLHVIISIISGVTWGLNGYAVVARNRNNSACGLAKYAMYPC